MCKIQMASKSENVRAMGFIMMMRAREQLLVGDCGVQMHVGSVTSLCSFTVRDVFWHKYQNNIFRYSQGFLFFNFFNSFLSLRE